MSPAARSWGRRESDKTRPPEINMLVQLYRLPHGTEIKPDGTWSVVR